MRQVQRDHHEHEVPHDRIAARAYERFVMRGGEHGRHLEDWFGAEEELRRELSAFSPALAKFTHAGC